MTTHPHRYAYTPDYACPPGDLIQEYLGALDISARELARRCGRSGKLMAEITSGRAPVEPETALQLERVLGVSASIWSGMEAAYQLHRAMEAENEQLESCYKWVSAFPMKELAERNLIDRTGTKSDQVREMLKFFGVGNVKACEERMLELLDGDYRTSTTFKNDELSLAAWLRIGERRAAEIETGTFARDSFIKALTTIRELTLIPIDKALPKLGEFCAAAGVAFILEKPLAKVRASGVSRWLSPRKALIQQSLRHKSDDHFWFTFFHECAHILLHSRREIFIDMAKGPGSGNPVQEAEANAWAADFLVPTTALKKFVKSFSGTDEEVKHFAAAHQIAPGIVVGQLQHAGVLGYNELNHLKVYYEWT